MKILNKNSLKCFLRRYIPIATEILEYCYSPEKVVDNIHKILKKCGICILSTRFIYPYHPDPGDFYRFTKDSLKYLFRKFSKKEICPHGNRLQVLWQILSTDKLKIFLNLLNPIFARIHFKDIKYPYGFVTYAKK